MSEPCPIPFRIAEGCRERVRTGWVFARNVEVLEAGEPLVEDMERTGRELHERHEGQTPGQVPGIATARGLYRSFGIDPTRTRPSSEALLRRAIRGRPLPRVCNAVDLANLCSLRFLLPLGLYDADRIDGAVLLREGKEAESYPGIRKDVVHLGGRPVLADEHGPFGNPTSDSLRTSVTPQTRSLWLVIFAPADYPAGTLQEHVQTGCSVMKLHAGPKVRSLGGLVP